MPALGEVTFLTLIRITLITLIRERNAVGSSEYGRVGRRVTSNSAAWSCGAVAKARESTSLFALQVPFIFQLNSNLPLSVCLSVCLWNNTNVGLRRT
jgi:hypothetical protein